MYGEQLYDLYAPAGGVWSSWVKPVVFAQMRGEPRFNLGPEWQGPPIDYLPDASERAAIVIEIPGHTAVLTALSLVAKGYRPVPLFNCCMGPMEMVDVDPIMTALAFGAEVLGNVHLPADAPPVFILDSDRCPAHPGPTPGRFDNRWVVLPQDFPSVHYLKSQRISRVIVVQNQSIQPDTDLAHVLLRWQEGGIPIYTCNAVIGSFPVQVRVNRPGHFRSLLHTVLALAGLRRNSAGGFGSIVPQPSESRGYG